jgi:hypothetical protein
MPVLSEGTRGMTSAAIVQVSRKENYFDSRLMSDIGSHNCYSLHSPVLLILTYSAGPKCS